MTNATFFSGLGRMPYIKGHIRLYQSPGRRLRMMASRYVPLVLGKVRPYQRHNFLLIARDPPHPPTGPTGCWLAMLATVVNDVTV